MSQLSIGGGLNNLGNTCFFNATLQSILHTSTLARILSTHQHSHTCPLKHIQQWCVFCEVQSIYNATRDSKRFSPNNMINHLRSIFKKFKLGRQQDSHEFLRYLIQGMQEAETGKLGKEREANEAKIRGSRVFKVFGGVMKTCVDCLNCNNKSITTERYYDFNIECQRSNTLVEGITSFFAVDKLQGHNKYLCEHCKTRSNARKRFLLESVPQVATFQLKRFTNSMRKIGKFIQFPITLDLGKYLQFPHKAIMKLYAIVVHSGGSSYSGHYYAFVRVGQNWFKMDDGYVSKCSIESVMSQNAYLLFYEKQFQQQNKPQQQLRSKSLPKENHVNKQHKLEKNGIIKGVEKHKELVPAHQQKMEQKNKPSLQLTKSFPIFNNQNSHINHKTPIKQDMDVENLQIPSGLKRIKSKQQAQRQMPMQEFIFRAVNKIIQLNGRLPNSKPRNQSYRQIYNLRRYQSKMIKKRKLV